MTSTIPLTLDFFRQEGFKWTHSDSTATYNFYENGEFRTSRKGSGTWTIEDYEDNQKLLKIVFNSKQQSTVYFRWSLQFGNNLSILEKQTGYEHTKQVTLF